MSAAPALFWADAAPKGYEYTMFLLRLIQPSIIIAIVLISVFLKPLTAFLTFVFAPNPSTINAATTRYGSSISAGPTRSASLPPEPFATSSTSIPEPTPVVVPVQSRRRLLTFVCLGALAGTYVISGAFIVLRAVIPPRQWTPASPRWQSIDLQALLGLIAWSSVAIACAYEETVRTRGDYGRGKAAWSVLIGFVSDVAIVVLYSLTKKHPIDQLPNSQLWVLGQLAVIAVRILLLYPLLAVALQWDQTRFVRASELRNQQQRENDGNANNATPANGDTERSALLHPNRAAAPGYGSVQGGAAAAATGSAPKPNGTSTPASGSRTPNANASAANASMGLTVTATPPPPTFTVFFQRVKILFPYLWPSQSVHLQLLAVFCVGLLIIGRFVNLFVPLTLGKIVEDLSSGQAPWWHITAYASLKMLQGSGGLLAVLQALAWLPIEQFSDRSLSLMAFDHLLHLSMAFHTRRKTGEILRILDRGAVISSFFQYLIFNVVPIFVDIAVAMVYLGTTFGWVVGLAIFAVMYFYTYVSVSLTTWRTNLRRQANNKDSISRAIHADVLINYDLVKVHSNEPYELDRYRTALLDYQEADYRVTASLNLLNFVQNSIITAGTLITCLFVARDVVSGHSSSSQFVVFITYLQQVYVPLAFLGTLHRVLMQNLVDTDKLMGLLEEESDVKDVPGAKDLILTEGVIEFRDVVFSYDGKVDALKGLNFKINAKESAALVGESGAGKSSIMRLLYRFYDIQQGQILIDGQDISKVKQASLRKAIGIVPQEPSLFNTSIYQNILYGDTNATEEMVEAAAKAAQIYDRIMSFPEQWKTIVGERGVKLSGGEKQRVALARTFLKNPTILLLDEATSALDSHTEKLLQVALKTIMQGRTSLTIAHRLSTIVNCDRIVVLDNGKVIENGSHGELVEKGGLYKSMWMQQIKTEEEAKTAAKEEEVAHATEIQGEQDQQEGTTGQSKPVEQKGLLGIVSPTVQQQQQGTSSEEPSTTSPSKLLSDSGHENLVRELSSKDLLDTSTTATSTTTKAAEPEAEVGTSKAKEVIEPVEANETSKAVTEEVKSVPSESNKAQGVTKAKAAEVAFPSAESATTTNNKATKGTGGLHSRAGSRDSSNLGHGPAPSSAGVTDGQSKESLRRRITSLIRRSPSSANSSSGGGPVVGPASTSTGGTGAGGVTNGEARAANSLMGSVKSDAGATSKTIPEDKNASAPSPSSSKTAQSALAKDESGSKGAGEGTTSASPSLLKPTDGSHQRNRSGSTASQASSDGGASGKKKVSGLR